MIPSLGNTPLRGARRWSCAAASLGLVVFALSIAGCGPSAEVAVRARYEKFSTLMLRGDTEACVPFVSPAKVRKAGTEGTKFLLGALHGMIKLANLKEGDIRCDRVEVGADRTTALVYSSFRLNGNWQSQQAGKWILIDGEWYIE